MNKTNEQAFEALIEKALVGTTLEERQQTGVNDIDAQSPDSVSYTHLTLPTICSV